MERGCYPSWSAAQHLARLGFLILGCLVVTSLSAGARGLGQVHTLQARATKMHLAHMKWTFSTEVINTSSWDAIVAQMANGMRRPIWELAVTQRFAGVMVIWRNRLTEYSFPLKIAIDTSAACSA